MTVISNKGGADNSESRPKYSIREVLPHTGRMLLLDRLVDYGDEHVVCEIDIERETLFCEGERGVPAWVGIEYMAQTAGAYSGIADMNQAQNPAICLLLGARRYESQVPYFAIGSRLRVVSRLILRDESDLAAFDCEILATRSGREIVLATGDIKAYRPSDLQAIIRGERSQ